MVILASVVLIIIFSLAIYTDVKTYKIRNVVTLPTALVGILLAFVIFPSIQTLLYVISFLAIGLLGEFLKLWKAGDTKLVLSTGTWSIFLVGQPILLFVLGYYFIFIVSHLVIGHFIGLKKYKFHLKTYLSSLFTGVNEKYGRFSGAITICISNLVILALFTIYNTIYNTI